MTEREEPMSEWRDRAACLGADPEIFFGGTHKTTQQARAICADCAVKLECLTEAVDNYYEHGIFAGTTPRQRKDLRRGRLGHGVRGRVSEDA